MSSAATAAIAQVIQGLAGAGSELTDISYKDKLSQRDAAAKQAKLNAINKRTQEILDAQKASASGIDLAGAKQSMGPLGSALYSSLAPTQASGSTSLADKIRAVATYPQQNVMPASGAVDPANAPPPSADDSPLWERTLNEIQTRQQPKVKPVVENALDRTAAWMQSAQEQGVPAEEIQKMAASGELLRNLVKDTTESGDKLTGEKNKTGMEYLQQTSQDKRQKETLDQQEKLAGLNRALREKLARMAESGKNARAQKLAETWKAQVAATNAITGANDKQQGRMIAALQAANKTRDPAAKAALLNAAGIPFDADSARASWFNPWSKKVLKEVVAHPERANQLYLDPNRAQRQGHIAALKAILGEPDDPSGDQFEDPITAPIVLPSTTVDPGSTLPGASPAQKPFR